MFCRVFFKFYFFNFIELFAQMFGREKSSKDFVSENNKERRLFAVNTAL
jgi:hypothetical protein